MLGRTPNQPALAASSFGDFCFPLFSMWFRAFSPEVTGLGWVTIASFALILNCLHKFFLFSIWSKLWYVTDLEIQRLDPEGESLQCMVQFPFFWAVESKLRRSSEPKDPGSSFGRIFSSCVTVRCYWSWNLSCNFQFWLFSTAERVVTKKWEKWSVR